MGVLAAAFKAMPKQDIETWIKSEPTGAVSRRAWFLYETLTGDTLDIEDAGAVTYVDALDPERHIVANGVRSRRHKVRTISSEYLGSTSPSGGRRRSSST